MAGRLVWSPEAVEDVESIAAYIERDSPWYARAVVSKIIEVADSIPLYPEMGRFVPEAGETSIRERWVYSYRVIYRLEAGRILLVAVVHGSRLMQPFLERFVKQ